MQQVLHGMAWTRERRQAWANLASSILRTKIIRIATTLKRTHTQNQHTQLLAGWLAGSFFSFDVVDFMSERE